MHRFGRWTLTMAVLVLWGTPAQPAEEKMVPGEGAIEVMMLRQKSVQDELKLTSDEKEKIHDFTTKQHKRAEALQDASEEEREKKFAQLSKENEAFVEGLLEPDQEKRFRQIMLQRAGLVMVTDPKVASALDLTEDQKEKARALQKEAHKEWVELHHATSKEARNDKIHELHMSSRKRLLNLLTDKQEAKFREMAGPPFEGKLEYHGGPDSK